MVAFWLGLHLLLFFPALPGQLRTEICTQDPLRHALPGSTVVVTGPGRAELDLVTAADGCAVLPDSTAAGVRSVRLAHQGFAPLVVPEPAAGTRLAVVLSPASAGETVTVTADRGLAGVTDQATSVAVLSGTTLRAAPGLSLDDALHQAAGFQLYRRTSSWTANPTTEGVSLRGLGSTAASRTLVESDEVPLNDPFGGWIHWDEIPSLALADVVLVRGGAADLFGSSAIGGVVEEDPVTAASANALWVSADVQGASESSTTGDLLVVTSRRQGSALLAGSGLTTGGYVPTAPELRGSVDTPANVAEESGRLELRSPARANGDTAFLRGNVLNEVRGNGTPEQTNGTRLWRYTGGGDLNVGQTHAALRLFGDRETYRQSFSSLAADRNSETLTRLQRVPVDEFGFSLIGARALPHQLTAAAGLDLRDIRATDAESPVSRGVVSAPVSISARQRDSGGYAEAVWQPTHWSVAGSVRVDSFHTFDGQQRSASSLTKEPETSELLANPHLGVVRQLPGGLALTANGFRAFRGPTLNELYRTGQVGQQTTMANPRLLAERATGFELGGEFAALRLRGRTLGRLRASYFWTEVNRPVSAVVLAQTATAQTLQRQNLGQIRSRGLSLEGGTATWRGMDVSAGYQLAVATVTAFNTASTVQANLLGKWIPEVPRNTAVTTVNWHQELWLNLHGTLSYTGRTFDDAANQFLLHPYARLDLSGDRALPHGFALYLGAQNLLDRRIDAGRTPLLTLAAPRLVVGGLRWEIHR